MIVATVFMALLKNLSTYRARHCASLPTTAANLVNNVLKNSIAYLSKHMRFVHDIKKLVLTTVTIIF